MAGKFTDYIKKNPNARETTPPSIDWEAQKKMSYERADAASKAVQDKNKNNDTPVR